MPGLLSLSQREELLSRFTGLMFTNFTIHYGFWRDIFNHIPFVEEVYSISGVLWAHNNAAIKSGIGNLPKYRESLDDSFTLWKLK